MNNRKGLREGVRTVEAETGLRRLPFVYGATVVFFALFYYRPEDFIGVLAYIPLAKIAGGAGFAAFLLGLPGHKVKIPVGIKVLCLLLVQMTMAIPFAIWPGGAFSTVFDKFAKGVVMAIMVSMAVVTLQEMRKLLWIQVSAVTLVTFFSIALHHHEETTGRLSGIQHSILANPNDLAINIAISFPLAMAFMLHGRGFKKVVWVLSLVVMVVGVVLTASRSGFLALILILFICIWEYGIKGKRRPLVVTMVLALLLGCGVAFSSSRYRARIASIVAGGSVEGSGDRGSLEARKELLKRSIITALKHPIFGVGPGCFPLVDSGWHVAHNAYTELAAETGFPGLILFLLAIGTTFKALRRIRDSQPYRDEPEFRLFTQALRAGVVGYLAGSFFASTEYNLYPYFMMGYAYAMARIADAQSSAQPTPAGDVGQRQLGNGSRRAQILWGR
jgi:O-antigen ligase